MSEVSSKASAGEIDTIGRILHVTYLSSMAGLVATLSISFAPYWHNSAPYLHLGLAFTGATSAGAYLWRTRGQREARGLAWGVLIVSVAWLACAVAIVAVYFVMRDFD